jgi:hypothetical protein
MKEKKETQGITCYTCYGIAISKGLAPSVGWTIVWGWVHPNYAKYTSKAHNSKGFVVSNYNCAPN